MRKCVVFLVMAVLLALLAGCSSSEKKYDSPTDLQITKIEEGKLKLTWRYSDSSNELTYTIARKLGEEDWTEAYLDTEDDSRSIIDEVDTENYLVYSYKVRANDNEEGTSSVYSTPIAYFSAKAFPSDLEITQIGQEQLELNWVDNTVGEEGYLISRKIGTGSWVEEYAEVEANVTSYQDSIDTLFEEVSYRISAFVFNSKSRAVEVSFMPVFSSPSGLTLEQLSQSQVKVSWTDNSDGELGFEIQRRIGAGVEGLNEWEEPFIVGVDETQYIDVPNIIAGTIYYRVRAYKDTMFSNYTEINSINFNLAEIGAVDLPPNGLDVYVYGSYAFIANEYNGIRAVNISNQQFPEDIGVISDPAIEGKVVSVFVDNYYLFVTNQNGVTIIDVLNMDAPLFMEYIDMDYEYFQPLDIVTGTINNQYYAFVAAGTAGLSIIKLDPAGTFGSMIVAQYNTHGVAQSVTIDGDHLYLADDADGVYKFDLSGFNSENNSYPIAVAELNFSVNKANSLCLFGDKLLVGCGENGLEVLDRNSLNEISSFDTQGFVKAVTAQGRFVYLADNDKGLTIVDLQDINNILEIANIDTESSANSIMIKDSYAYLLTNNKLHIIQIIP